MKDYDVDRIFQNGQRKTGKGSLLYQDDYISGPTLWKNIWHEEEYKIYFYDTSIIFNV